MILTCAGWASLLPALLAIFCIQFCQAHTIVIKLEESAQWTLSNIHGFNNVSLDDVAIPSYVLDTLQQQAVINPHHHLAHRFNERELAWVANDSWTYTAVWNIDPKQLNFEDEHRHRALLLLHGIDTAATITLNSRSLGNVANSHRRHVFDITDSIEKGVNLLEITIHPAAVYAATQAAAHYEATHYSVPFTRQLGNSGQYNFIRKAASDFGWDWGPAFAPAGLSAGVEILIRTSSSDDDSDGDGGVEEIKTASTAPSTSLSSPPVYFMDLGLRQHHSDTNDSILVTVDAFFRPMLTPAEVEKAKTHPLDEIFTRGVLEIKITGPHGSNSSDIGSSLWSREVELAFSIEELVPPTKNNSSTTFRKKEKEEESADWVIQRSVEVLVTPPFELWWPWDLGTPVLYNVEVKFKALERTSNTLLLKNPESVLEVGREKEAEEEDEDEAEKSVGGGSGYFYQVVHRQIGFRTVELIQEPITTIRTDKTNKNGKETAVIGETFYFKINKIPVFARGANIVPLDLLPTKVSLSKIHHAVPSARHANMNFLRVWGGGRYFSDAFYEECDTAGILVWQEFMYACSMYPATPFYLHEATEEARQQVLRINSHPSVVIWGGNNENEAAFTWFIETKKFPQRYRADYEILFVRLLREMLLSLDPGAVYVDSSPSNGLIKDPSTNSSSGSFKKKWGDVTDPTQGDVHFYDYFSNLLDPNSYPKAKFISEFGYMSLPSFDSYAKQSKREDWVVGGALMKYRMRHGDGLQQIENQLKMHFKLPTKLEKLHNKASNKSIEDQVVPFQAYIYLTQLQQALIYDTAATTWRRGKNDPVSSTAGVLYWQLNDVWSGPSWSGMNYDGRWKALHYAARRFFSPVAVFGSITTRSGGGRWSSLFRKQERNEEIVEVWVVNDGKEDVQGTVEIHAVPFQSTSASDRVDLLSFSLANTTSVAVTATASSGSSAVGVTVPGSGSVVAWRSDFRGTPWGSVREAASQVYLQIRFCTAAAEDFSGGGSSSGSSDGCVENVMLLGELKDAHLAESVQVEATVEEFSDIKEKKQQQEEERVFSRGGDSGGSPNKVFEVTLTAQGGVALYVFLESPFTGYFSENLFMVAPSEPRKISFFVLVSDEKSEEGKGEISSITEEEVTQEEFRASLRVIWLQKALNDYSGVVGGRVEEKKKQQRRQSVTVTGLSVVKNIVLEMVLLTFCVLIFWSITCIYRFYT